MGTGAEHPKDHCVRWAWISFPAYSSDDSPLRDCFSLHGLHGVGVGDGLDFLHVPLLFIVAIRLPGSSFLLIFSQDWEKQDRMERYGHGSVRTWDVSSDHRFSSSSTTASFEGLHTWYGAIDIGCAWLWLGYI